MWSDNSHLHLGGMLGASGKRMRRISGQLKLDVVAAADEFKGTGITKASQPLAGMGAQADSSSALKRSACHLRWRYRGRRRSIVEKPRRRQRPALTNTRWARRARPSGRTLTTCLRGMCRLLFSLVEHTKNTRQTRRTYVVCHVLRVCVAYLS